MLGSLADWSTAGIALLAFIIAAIAARATLKTNNAQQAQLALQLQQYKQQQAVQVSFWLEGVLQSRTDRNVTIINASNLPVYDVGLFVKRKDSVEWKCLWHQRVVTPNAQTPLELIPHRYNIGPQGIVYLGFRDSSGEHWLREQYGKLREDDVFGGTAAQIMSKYNALKQYRERNAGAVHESDCDAE